MFRFQANKVGVQKNNHIGAFGALCAVEHSAALADISKKLLCTYVVGNGNFSSSIS